MTVHGVNIIQHHSLASTMPARFLAEIRRKLKWSCSKMRELHAFCVKFTHIGLPGEAGPYGSYPQFSAMSLIRLLPHCQLGFDALVLRRSMTD
jgi:hypothetical protein